MSLFIRVRFTPIRVRAHTDDYSVMVVEVRNEGDREVLLSLDTGVSKRGTAGFDRSGIQKIKSVRLGTLGPMEVKEVNIPIYTSRLTGEGQLPILIQLNVHDTDYNRVLYNHRKKVFLRVVE